MGLFETLAHAGFADPLGGEAGGQRGQAFLDDQDIPHFAPGELAQGGAAMAREFYQSFGGELLQGFANRAAAEFEFLSEVGFDQALTRHVATGAHPVAQRFGGAIGQAGVG
jgi:hypothetical protein